MNRCFDIAQVIAVKLVALARRLTGNQEVVVSADSLASFDFVSWMKALATSVVEGRRVDRAGDVELDQVAEDLFAFLAALPLNTESRLLTAPLHSVAPARALEEPSSGVVWQLAALVQDVWEHTLGCEAVGDAPLSQFLDSWHGRTVLDFGAGAGFWAFRLARQQVSVVCIEPNGVKRQFLRFRQRSLPEGRWVSLRPGIGLHDMVLLIDVLDHTPEPAKVIRRLAKRLRPGGLLLCRAAFPEDGWHTGGEEVRRVAVAAMARSFEFDLGVALGDQAVCLVRKRVDRSGRSPVLPSTTAQLHPAAVLRTSPGDRDHFILAAPYFYVEPLLLSRDGAALARMCISPRRVQQLGDAMAERGFTLDEVKAGLLRMHEANVIQLSISETTSPEHDADIPRQRTAPQQNRSLSARTTIPDCQSPRKHDPTLQENGSTARGE
jgi:SAM-dependent methyltransferase